MADSRQGLNCSLFYRDQQNQVQTYRVRADYYSHDYQLIAEESQGRINRAFYPHRVTPTQFAVQVLLRGTFEYRHFMNWLKEYSFAALSDNETSGPTRLMGVGLAGRDFIRLGIPTAGYAFGDRVGAMVWTVPIIFIAANDPLQTNDPYQPSPSYFIDASRAVTEQDLQYFYPMSAFANGTADSAYYDDLTKAAAATIPKTVAGLDAAKIASLTGGGGLSQLFSATAGTASTPTSSYATWGHD